MSRYTKAQTEEYKRNFFAIIDSIERNSYEEGFQTLLSKHRDSILWTSSMDDLLITSFCRWIVAVLGYSELSGMSPRNITNRIFYLITRDRLPGEDNENTYQPTNTQS